MLPGIKSPLNIPIINVSWYSFLFFLKLDVFWEFFAYKMMNEMELEFSYLVYPFSGFDFRVILVIVRLGVPPIFMSSGRIYIKIEMVCSLKGFRLRWYNHLVLVFKHFNTYMIYVYFQCLFKGFIISYIFPEMCLLI